MSPGLLPDAEVDELREEVLGVMPDTCTILSYEKVGGGGGNSKRDWTPRTEVACGFAPIGGGEGGPDQGEQAADNSTHIFTLPAQTDITTAERIELDGHTYEVTLVRRRGSWELVRRVEVSEVSGAS